MNIAIILAAGSGKRMHAGVKKQYMLIEEKPMLYYTLKAFQDCEDVHKIILVTGEEDIEYCRQDIIGKYQFHKVTDVVSGGAERYDSVYQGLQCVAHAEYILVHDGARPFITAEQISILIEETKIHKACIAAVKAKDTIKISDENGYVVSTPLRKNLWIVQTPQVFEAKLLLHAYDNMMGAEKKDITDDAMVVEQYGHHPVRLVELSYENIKITTPEDLLIGEAILKKRAATRIRQRKRIGKTACKNTRIKK